MNISEYLEGTNLTLVLEGSFDEISSPDIEDKVEEVLSRDVESVTLNLSKVRYISSAGIRVLIVAHKKAVKLGKRVLIGEMSVKVREIIEMVGIMPLFAGPGR
ncbi:MAG: STAS domain-containing protein [Candidatus Omnitrophota bacterium]|nr:STAS domain-containing protein [Candidatus Omnitrophota bacterium]